MGLWKSRIGFSLAAVLLSLAQPALCAESNAVQWSLDGGAHGGRHRGSGTGVAASIEPEGLVPGIGLLLVDVADASGSVTAGLHAVTGQDLREAADGTLQTAAPKIIGGIAVRRTITTSRDNSIVWVDAFSNISDRQLRLDIVWGGQIGADSLTPAKGQAGILLFEGKAQSVALVVGAARQPLDLVDIRMSPVLSPYPGPDPSFMGIRHRMILDPGQTHRLAHAVVGEDAGRTSSAEVLAQADRVATALSRDGAAVPAGGDGIDISRASIAELRHAVIAGRISVRGIAELYVARMEDRDAGPDGLRAFIARNTGLLAEADALDAQWRRNPDAYPLLGSVFAVKDNIAVAGMALTLGLKDLALPLAADAAIVAKLRSLGALVSGKTNLDELASNVFGLSESGGQTLNPHAQDRSPGGSSAGSAVAVATGLSTFSLGTDTCDSILQPAAQAGVVGFRPTVGLLPLSGVAPGIPGHDVVGPFATSVADIKAIMERVAGISVPSDGRPLSERRLGRLVLEPAVAGDALVDPAMSRALAAAALRGATVIDIPFEPEPFLAPIRDSLLLDDARLAELAYLKTLPGMRRATLAAVGNGDRLLAAPRGPRSYMAGFDKLRPDSAERRKTQADGTRRFHDALVALLDMHRLDALVLPVARGAPSLIGLSEAVPGVCEFSAWTGMPAVSLPVGTIRGTSWPVGMLLLGRRNGDADLLALAAALETSVGNSPHAD